MAIHGGVSGSEELPTRYNHHSVCLGPHYCTLSKGEEGMVEERKGEDEIEKEGRK